MFRFLERCLLLENDDYVRLFLLIFTSHMLPNIELAFVTKWQISPFNIPNSYNKDFLSHGDLTP